MYLTELNKKTGLLDIEDIEDGVLAIKEFREVINNKDLGLECMTAIALVADYKSPIRFYNEEDRPKAAMENVTGNRKAYNFKSEKIQLALKKYDALQYDPSLEEKRIHEERKVRKLKEIKDADLPPEKDKDGNEIKRKPISTLTAELRKINEDIKAFKSSNEGDDLFSGSPVKNGYKLTRLERILEKKNSFYNTVR